MARNCTDWYQLLDLCGLRQCLVDDQDGVYDPATPNGRLILGLKGLIAELELHTLRARMTAGLMNKAKRGELALTLPTGLVREPSGQVVKHPDREVQSRLELVFATFLRVASVNKTVRYFNEQHLRLPRRLPGKLTVPQVVKLLGVPLHWVYQRIERGEIEVPFDPVRKMYLFPDDPRTLTLLRQLRAGRVRRVRIGRLSGNGRHCLSIHSSQSAIESTYCALSRINAGLSCSH